MSEIHYGAGKITLRKPSPRAKLEAIMEEHPSGRSRQWAQLLYEACSPEELEVICEYFVVNHSRQIRRMTSTEKEERSKAIKEAAKVVFLELLMTNGKPLRECTFQEVKGFGLGYQRLSQMGKPRQKVSVLTEKQVRDALS